MNAKMLAKAPVEMASRIRYASRITRAIVDNVKVGYLLDLY